MTLGPEAQGIWNAQRAQGTNHWKHTIGEILDILHSPKIYQRLRFTLPTESSFAERGPPDLLQEERDVLHMMWQLGLEMCAQYTCTHCMFGLTFPHCFSVFLLPDDAERTAAVKEIQKSC